MELNAQALGLLSDADRSVLSLLGELRRTLRDLERTDRGAAEIAAILDRPECHPGRAQREPGPPRDEAPEIQRTGSRISAKGRFPG